MFRAAFAPAVYPISSQQDRHYSQLSKSPAYSIL